MRNILAIEVRQRVRKSLIATIAIKLELEEYPSASKEDPKKMKKLIFNFKGETL